MKSRLVTNRQRIIHLPYQVVTTGELLPPPRIQQESDDWKCLIEPVDEIVRMARAQGVTPMIFLLPSAATVYSQYDVTLARYDEHHQLIYDALQSHLATQAVPLSDLQQQLRVELHKHFIFAHQADYHLNSLGVQKVSEQVVTALRLMGHT